MTLAAVQTRQLVDLGLEVGFVVRGDGQYAGVHGGVGATGEGGQLAAAGVAQDVHLEEAILRRHVAQAEHGAGTGGAVHVRNAELLVAYDGDVGARADAAGDVTRLDAEARVLEVLGHVGGVQARRAVEQVAVHRVLIVGVRRSVGVVALISQQLARVDEAVGARRQDVVKAAGAEVVGPVGRDVGGCRTGRKRQCDRRHHEQSADHPRPLRVSAASDVTRCGQPPDAVAGGPASPVRAERPSRLPDGSLRFGILAA